MAMVGTVPFPLRNKRNHDLASSSVAFCAKRIRRANNIDIVGDHWMTEVISTILQLITIEFGDHYKQFSGCGNLFYTMSVVCGVVILFNSELMD